MGLRSWFCAPRATGSHRKRGTLLPGPGPGGVPWAGLYCLSWKSPLHLSPVPSEDTLTVSKDRPCLLAWLAEAVAPVGFPAQEPHTPCDLPQFDSRTGLCVCSSHAAPAPTAPRKAWLLRAWPALMSRYGTRGRGAGRSPLLERQGRAACQYTLGFRCLPGSRGSLR